MKDLYHNLKGSPALNPQALAKTGSPFTGTEVNLKGDSALIVVQAGALGTQVNTYTFELQESDVSGSGFTPVADADLLGSEPVFEYATSPAKDESNTIKTFGYIGIKGYLKLVVTVAGAGTGSGIIGAAVIVGDARHRPVV